ncbi:ABC transporter substrate-binding protein [Entomospira entomophila]|uniref:Solute-binding protein family 5 domain-containing protein n=1 Tax=Entomospira entomophila TaxID=2719988 RepID=A0A968G8A3_9SPIO|nr:ABC transporter substrate-binding protein [Entomospira entomophilus]NIZ40400.1 hypothetical protein [Entomospira entomophilus]WDI35959.1 ABC transporter substrate-binding protein [Entomospira entomophilus]
MMSLWLKFIFIALLATLSGCGHRSTSAGVSKVLRIAIPIEPESLNPLHITSADMVAVFDNIYDALLIYDSIGNLHPNLAESWSAFDENRRYELILKEGIIFQNGEAFTADDVVYSFLTHAKYSSKYADIVSVEATSPYGIRFLFHEPNSDFPNLLATTWIFSHTEVENPKSGTGAYQFERYDAGRVLKFKRFNDSFHHREKLAFFEGIEFLIIKETPSVLMGLRSGAIDMSAQMDPTVIDVQMEQQLQVMKGPQNLTNLMALNNQRPPFDNIAVRRAINHAVDKERVIQFLVNGDAVRLDTGMSVVLHDFYNHELENFYEYNPSKARELLEELGYSKQKPLSFTVHVPSNYPMHMRSAEIIANQLADIDIHMQIEPVEWAVWLSEIYQGRNYQATIVGLAGKLSAYQQLVRFSERAQVNLTNFSHEDFEAYLQKAMSAGDRSEQIVAFHQAQYVLTEQANSLFLMDPSLAVVTRANLHGVEMYPTRTFRVRDYYLST